MVVIKRPISHYLDLGYANKGRELIHCASLVGKTLNGADMNSLVGILHQLSALSAIANELFQSVLDSSKETFTRISDISTRIKNVNEQLDVVEMYAMKSSSTFYKNQSFQMKEESLSFLRKKNEQNIHKTNFPAPLKWQYDTNCEKVPDFGSLNDLHEKKDCLKDYSDPSFFFESWAVSELEKQEKKKKERKAKKEKRKVEGVKQNRLKEMYDEHGEKSDRRGQQQGPGTSDIDFEAPLDEGYVPPPPPDELPPPPPLEEEVINRQSSSFNHPIQRDDSSSEGFKPPPPPPRTIKHINEDDVGLQNDDDDDKEASQMTLPNLPSTLNLQAPPPPPMVGGIQTGGAITFKKADQAPLNRKQTAAVLRGGQDRSSLLDSIRGKDNMARLKKVVVNEKPKEPEKPKEAGGFNVTDILNKKFANTRDSDDEDEDEEDW